MESAEALDSKTPLEKIAEQEAAPPEAAAAPSRPRPRRSRGPRRAIAAGLVIFALAGGALGASTLFGDDNQSATPKAPGALAAVPDQPLKPRKGQTLAGAVYDTASPAVVSVRAGADSGTAFLVDKNGTLVTNAHVVNGASRVIIHFGRDGVSVDADVLGTDPSTDLAALSIPRSAIPAGVKPLQFADSRNVRVGDTAIAIGNPFGLDRTATEGIISALGRDIQAPNGFSIENVLQTDAPINPGNSGGPLLDTSAHVIGVTSQIATSGTSRGNVGIGFAVPSNTVRSVLPALMRGQTIKRAYLGVQTGPPDPGRPSGAQVGGMTAGGPADKAGMRTGDVIRRIDGTSITNAQQLSTLIQKKQPGDQVTVVVDRGGSSQTFQVTLGTRPASTP
jgi:putative serine protease PepD